MAEGLMNLSQFCTITEFYYTPGSQSLHMPASLAKALKCQQLSVLCLASANMRNPATGHLATVVEACKKLQRLDISHTYLGDSLMKQLAPALGKCTTLQTLELTMCCLGRDGAHWLPGIFQPALKILNLSNNHVRTHTGAVMPCSLHLAERACYCAES
jgi:Ran GTPase-activating protein (RanGAP) involved in mRNA processing and transport